MSKISHRNSETDLFVEITCEGSRWIKLDDLVPFQGDLKTLSKMDFDKGTKSLKKHGFTFPFFVWENKGKLMVLDGHQRDRILKQHRSEGKKLPDKFPAVGVRAKSEKEAKEKILLLSSQYGKYSYDSVYEFIEQSDLDFSDLSELIDLPQIDLEKFALSYYQDFTGDFFDPETKPDVLPQIRMVVVADLKPHPKNYREHPDDQIEHLIASLRETGSFRYIVVANDNTILAGHSIYKAATKLGLKRLPAIHLDLDPDEPKALKVLIGDNEMGHLAEIDDRALSNVLKEIKDKDNLMGTGYDEKMLAALAFTTRTANEIRDFDAAAHWAGMPDFDSGTEECILVVAFSNPQDRGEFVKQKDIQISRTGANDKTWSAHWPHTQSREDVSSLRWEAPEE